MQKYTVARQRLPLEVLPPLWAILFTRYQDDDGSGETVESSEALSALLEIGKVLKRKRSAILKGILKTPDQRQLFKALLTEVEEILDNYESDDGDLNGNEELDPSASRQWLESWKGPGSLVTPEVARAMHEFMKNSGICTWDPAEADEVTEDSYVMYDGPIKTLMDDFLHDGDGDGDADKAEAAGDGDEAEFIPEDVFRSYEAFRREGRENALMFFAHHPEHDKWGPWIMTSGNYEAALKRYPHE